MVRLLRPHQYTKNLLLFAAPGAAGRLGDLGVLGRAGLAFVAFCAVSSAGYVANDLADIEADRAHPTKRNRPIASGAVAPQRASQLLFGLLAAAFVVAPLISGWFALALAGYALLSFSYSNLFKRIAWLELVIVSAGFLVRAAAGGVATDTRLSQWFLVVVSAGALFMITGKRLGELMTLGADSLSRSVLRKYTQPALRLMATAASLVAVTGYIGWAASDATKHGGSDAGDLLLRLTTLPFVAAMARYLVLCRRGEGEAPDVLVIKDRAMLLFGGLWVGLYALGLTL